MASSVPQSTATPSERRRSQQREEARRKILGAAESLLVDHGYEGFSMRRLVERWPRGARASGHGPGTAARSPPAHRMDLATRQRSADLADTLLDTDLAQHRPAAVRDDHVHRAPPLRRRVPGIGPPLEDTDRVPPASQGQGQHRPHEPSADDDDRLTLRQTAPSSSRGRTCSQKTRMPFSTRSVS